MRTPITAKTNDWQTMGGILDMPDGWFVTKVDLDATEPFAIITKDRAAIEEQRVLIPKALAYYLGTHFCGSAVMHDLIVEKVKGQIQNTITEALGL